MFQLTKIALTNEGIQLVLATPRPVGRVEYRCDAHLLEAGITDLLIYEFVRLADDYVSEGMGLVPNWSTSDRARTFDLLSMMVQSMDLQSSHKECCALLRRSLPAGLGIVGEKTWSGYAARRAQFDQLTALGDLIHVRVVADGATSCMVCLFPVTDCCCTHAKS